MRKALAEIRERRKRLGIVRRFQIGVAEIVGNVVSELAGAGLRPVERVNGFGIIVIERARIAEYQPGQRAGVFFGVATRKGFNPGIGDGSAVLQQLLRHGPKTGGGNKGLPHPADARREGFTLLPGAGGRGSGCLSFSRRAFSRWRTFCRCAFNGGALSWSALR